jgi:hypothetical protein
MKNDTLTCCRETFPGILAGALGKGLIAGLAGSIVMTLAQNIEMKLTKRSPSSTPVDAAGKALGAQPVDESSRQRLNNVVHYTYGSMLGTVRAVLALLGIRGLMAVTLHTAFAEAMAMTLLPLLKVAPPPSRWGAKAIAMEIMHHAIYAAGTGAAYGMLERCVKVER